MRILMIEDDKRLCDSVQFQLEKHGFSVDTCHDGEDGLYLIREGAFDLVLLDRMLPGMDGIHVLQCARENGIRTPIILLTALGELNDRVQGLDFGADDYIVKPFAFEELLARIRSALRRPIAWSNEQIFSLGNTNYNSTQRTLSKNGDSCTLSKREGDLLELLIRNHGQVLPRLLILSRIWGPDGNVEDGNLDNYIYFVRRRLKSIQSNLVIRSIRGVGYRLEVKHVK